MLPALQKRGGNLLILALNPLALNHEELLCEINALSGVTISQQMALASITPVSI